MNFENEPQPHAPKRRDISLFEGIRTFAASVGTAALLMLSVCGLIGLPLPETQRRTPFPLPISRQRQKRCAPCSLAAMFSA